MANHLRKVLKLSPEKRALLNELGDPRSFTDPSALADQLKSLPLRVTGTAALDQAISTAGGVDWSALDDEFMLRAMPGVFCAGEMIDWDAPTGGYLLTACFATGRAAGQGAVRWLKNRAAA